MNLNYFLMVVLFSFRMGLIPENNKFLKFISKFIPVMIFSSTLYNTLTQFETYEIFRQNLILLFIGLAISLLPNRDDFNKELK